MKEHQELTLEQYHNREEEIPTATPEKPKRTPMTEEQILKKQAELELLHQQLEREIEYKQKSEKSPKKPWVRSNCCEAPLKRQLTCTNCNQEAMRVIGFKKTKTVITIVKAILITKMIMNPRNVFKIPGLIWKATKATGRAIKHTWNWLDKTLHKVATPNNETIMEGPRMGGRYIISGTQIAILKAVTPTQEERKILEEIEEEQYIGDSQNSIREDAAEARKEVCLGTREVTGPNGIKPNKEEIQDKTLQKKLLELGINRDYTEAELASLGINEDEFRKAIKSGDLFETRPGTREYRVLH